MRNATAVLVMVASAGCIREHQVLSYVPLEHKTKVYYLQDDSQKKDATVTAQNVFDRIQEYREIRDGLVTPGDAEYWLLLTKASDRFQKAVRKVALEKNLSVLEQNPHLVIPMSLDVTQNVIDALE